MSRSFKIQSIVKWCLSCANTTRTCDYFTFIGFIISKITDIHIKVMRKSNEKLWPTACQHFFPYNFPSKGLLSCPGNMVPESINKLEGAGNSTPPSILVHMDQQSFCTFILASLQSILMVQIFTCRNSCRVRMNHLLLLFWWIVQLLGY